MPQARSTIAIVVTAGLALTGVAAATPGPIVPSQRLGAATTSAHAARQVHDFLGTVTSRERSHRRFWIHTSANRSILLHTTAGTHWDSCDWDDMVHGHHVDVHAYRSHGTWIAAAIQNSHHHAGDEPHHRDGAQHE